MTSDKPLEQCSDTSLVEQLAQLWASGRTPDLDVFLSGLPPPPPGVLAQLAGLDQSERWRQGQRLAAEHYLRRYPLLAGDPEAALELVYSEYVTRQENGETLDPVEFQQRFPHLAETIACLVRLDRFLSSETPPDDTVVAALRSPGPSPPSPIKQNSAPDAS